MYADAYMFSTSSKGILGQASFRVCAFHSFLLFVCICLQGFNSEVPTDENILEFPGLKTKPVDLGRNAGPGAGNEFTKPKP